MEHPGLIAPGSVEMLDNLSDGRLLSEVYGYEPGWGYPSERDRTAITAIMAATDEKESEPEGPPKTAEDGARADDAAAETSER